MREKLDSAIFDFLVVSGNGITVLGTVPDMTDMYIVRVKMLLTNLF